MPTLCLISDLRSCKQRQRYFSFFCNKRIMVAWSVQSNSSRSYLYSSSSTIFVIHHYDYPHKLYINDNAVIALNRINRVSSIFAVYLIWFQRCWCWISIIHFCGNHNKIIIKGNREKQQPRRRRRRWRVVDIVTNEIKSFT